MAATDDIRIADRAPIVTLDGGVPELTMMAWRGVEGAEDGRSSGVQLPIGSAAVRWLNTVFDPG